jgi:hypothetical protein
MSTDVILAWGCVLRTVASRSIRSAWRSEENLNSPRTFGTPSGPGVLVPTMPCRVAGVPIVSSE